MTKVKTKKVLINARTGKFASKRYVKENPQKSVAVTCERKKCK